MEKEASQNARWMKTNIDLCFGLLLGFGWFCLVGFAVGLFAWGFYLFVWVLLGLVLFSWFHFICFSWFHVVCFSFALLCFICFSFALVGFILFALVGFILFALVLLQLVSFCLF